MHVPTATVTAALLGAACLLSSGCGNEAAPGRQLEKLLPLVQRIELVREDQGPQSVLVHDPIALPVQPEQSFQTLSLTSAPVSKQSSSIIVTEDTIGLFAMPGEVDCPCPPEARVLVSIDLQPGEYYCQEHRAPRTTRVNGPIADLGRQTPASASATYDAAQYVVVATGRTQICVYSTANLDEPVQCFSTDGRRVCVYLDNGTYTIIETGK